LLNIGQKIQENVLRMYVFVEVILNKVEYI
jgi:hypothetical protein